MTKQISKIMTIFSVFIMLLLMIATRGSENWLSSFIHLPDFTIPALFIAGVYFRHFWVVFVIIVGAVLIDNYAIVYQGVSAHCITPAYSLLPLTYYGVFWASKNINALVINNDIIKNSLVIFAIATTQWIIATSSYYFFTDTYAKDGWSNFPAYIAKWSVVEIPYTLYWMLAVIVVFTLIPRVNLSLNKHTTI